MGYRGNCAVGNGMVFKAVYSGIGYINERVRDYSRVSISRNLISQLKILVQSSLKPGIVTHKYKKIKLFFCLLDYATDLSSFWKTATLGYRGILGVQSSIGQQNSAKLALVQPKGSRVPVAHPYPKISKVLPSPQMFERRTQK